MAKRVSEGELKKRFFDMCHPCKPNCTFRKIEKILDEAKQEFPKINTFCLFETDDNWKVLQWFEKWLGDAEIK